MKAREHAIARASGNMAREIWNVMERSEEAGENGITDAMGVLGSLAAAVADRASVKEDGWKYLRWVIDQAEIVGTKLREDLDAGRRVPPPVKP